MSGRGIKRKRVEKKEKKVKEEEVVVEEEDSSVRTGRRVLREALDAFALNRNEDVTVYSEIPDLCKTATCYVGIDEAGRGPVLGPMVYAIFAAVCDQEAIDTKVGKGESLEKVEEKPPILLNIKKLNDSKVLTEKVREEIFAQFSRLDHTAFGFKIISPAQISAKSYRRQKVSLNEVSHQAAIELIQGLAERGVRIGKVYVDTVGPMDKYQKRLEMKFPDLRFKVDKKADSKYKPVSAASVVAKVTRDQALKEWTFPGKLRVKIPKAGWGSGYPGDAVTKRFLRWNSNPVFGFPNIVRDSWSTASDLLDKKGVKVKWEVDETEAPITPKISRFFIKKARFDDPNPKCYAKPKSQFYSYRGLTNTYLLF